MNADLLKDLRERTAFKPKPPNYELALAHVPLGEAGLKDPVEQRLLDAMVSEDESSVLVVAPPGGGKSSLLAWSAAEVAADKERRVVPVYVPVGHHAVRIDASLVVRGVAEGLAQRLASDLKSRERDMLAKSLAISVTTSKRPARLRAGLKLPPLHGLTADVAIELGHDLTVLAQAGGWQGGPHSGLTALADLTRAYEGHLVVIVEDTDIWSAGDPDMAGRAGAFFSAMRSLVACPDVTTLVAVQSHWGEPDSLASSQSRNAGAAYRELRSRASRVLVIPTPASEQQAHGLVCSVLDRRIQITVGGRAPSSGWSSAVFSEDALELLAKRCLKGTVRQVLTDVRDTFDHHETLPDLITRDDIIEAMDA